jgi:hypothetical protein
MRPVVRFIGLVGLILIFVSLIGCRSLQPVIEQSKTDTITITEIQRDTTLFVVPDSSMVRAWFECDSLNQVVMTKLEQQSGRKLQQVVKWKNNTIEVVANIDSQAVYFAWHEKHIREQSITETVVKEPVKEPPWWKQTKMPVTVAFLLFILILFKLIKK